MPAYTLRIKFTTPLDPDAPEIRRLTEAVARANRNGTNGLAVLQGFERVLTMNLGSLMIDRLVEPTTITIEYEGAFHKVKRKR